MGGGDVWPCRASVELCSPAEGPLVPQKCLCEFVPTFSEAQSENWRACFVEPAAYFLERRVGLVHRRLGVKYHRAFFICDGVSFGQKGKLETKPTPDGALSAKRDSQAEGKVALVTLRDATQAAPSLPLPKEAPRPSAVSARPQPGPRRTAH